MMRWLLAVLALLSAGCAEVATDVHGTSVSTDQVSACELGIAAVSTLPPSEGISLDGRSMVLLLEFKSPDDLRSFVDNLKEIALNDSEFREAVAGINFTATSTSTVLAVEFPAGTSTDDVCHVYLILDPHLTDLVDASIFLAE